MTGNSIESQDLCFTEPARGAGERRSSTKFLSILLIGIAINISTSAAAQAGAQGKPPAAAANPFPAEASKLGVRKCANLYSALGQTAAHGSTYGVQTYVNKAAPDAHPVQGVVGMTYSGPGHRGQAAGIVLAAPVGPACEGQMVRVAPYQQSCKDVVDLLPAGSAPGAILSGVPVYNLGGNQGQALLVASGASCVVVTVAQGTDVR